MSKDTKPTSEQEDKKEVKATHTVGNQPIYEGGQSYPPGAGVALTKTRAKALGKLVTAVTSAD